MSEKQPDGKINQSIKSNQHPVTPDHWTCPSQSIITNSIIYSRFSPPPSFSQPRCLNQHVPVALSCVQIRLCLHASVRQSKFRQSDRTWWRHACHQLAIPNHRPSISTSVIHGLSDSQTDDPIISIVSTHLFASSFDRESWALPIRLRGGENHASPRAS